MEVLDRLGGVILAEAVIQLLDGGRVQGVKLDRAHGGLEVVPDVLGVVKDRLRLDAAQIVPLPDVEPLAHGKLAGSGVAALVDLHGGGLELLPDLLLGLAGKAALDLLAGAGVPAGGDPGLPVGVRLAVAGDSLLANGSRAFR